MNFVVIVFFFVFNTFSAIEVRDFVYWPGGRCVCWWKKSEKAGGGRRVGRLLPISVPPGRASAEYSSKQVEIGMDRMTTSI